MNVFNGIRAFIATIFTMIGALLLLLGDTGSRDESRVFAFYFGILLWAGAIFLFSLVVKSWKSTTEERENKLRAEIMRDMRQELGLDSKEVVSDANDKPVAVEPDPESQGGDDLEDL